MSSKSDDLCIGIYFGASSTLVSYADSKTKNTQYPLIENSTGSYKTPSVVAFPNDSPPLIGEAALDYAKIDPTKVFTNIKLFLGQKLHDPKMEHLFQNCPNKVIGDADDNPLFLINYKGKEKYVPAEFIAALILQEAKYRCELKLGKSPDKVVITIPGTYNQFQRKAILNASKIAGLNCIRLVNDLSAQMISYKILEKGANGTYFVFHFGGGSVDISVQRITENKIEVLASDGIPGMTGQIFDVIIADFIKQKFEQKYQIKIGKDERTNFVLLKACEEAKKQICNTKSVSIRIPNFCQGKDIDMTLTEAKIFYVCEEAIDNRFSFDIQSVIEIMLDGLQLNPEDIDYVMLFGGSTNFPYIKNMIKEYFNEVQFCIPDSIQSNIPKGAAILCNQISHSSTETQPFQIIERLSLSIGIRQKRITYKPIILESEPIPQKKTFPVKLQFGPQESPFIEIFQGKAINDEIDLSEYSHINLGKYVIQAPIRGKSSFNGNITFEVDESGILSNVSAEIDNKSIPMKVTAKEAIDQDTMEELQKLAAEIYAEMFHL